MKRVIACALFLVPALLTYAQGAKVLNAYNYMNDNELIKAKAEIEAATTHDKTKDDAKTWYYRGLIYENIYKNSFALKEGTEELVFPELKDHRDGAVLESVQSYEKAIALGSKKINMTEVKQHHAEMSKWCYQEGVNHYNQKEYEKAAEMFGKCYDVKKLYGQIDTLALYNSALSYKLSGNLDKAHEQYDKCIEHKYNVEACYLDMLHMYREAGEKDTYKAMLAEARAALPNNQDIIQEEINIYIEAGDYDKALNNLNTAIEAEPTNVALIYARGIILDNKQAELRKQDGQEAAAKEAYAKAEADYKRVIEIDPEGFDGNYSLGALYYNLGAEMLNSANNILDDAKYKTAKAAAEKQLMAALPYLEKAHALDPDDMQTMQSLKVIYARTNQMDKFNAIKEKLEN